MSPPGSRHQGLGPLTMWFALESRDASGPEPRRGQNSLRQRGKRSSALQAESISSRSRALPLLSGGAWHPAQGRFIPPDRRLSGPGQVPERWRNWLRWRPHREPEGWSAPLKRWKGAACDTGPDGNGHSERPPRLRRSQGPPACRATSCTQGTSAPPSSQQASTP